MTTILFKIDDGPNWTTPIIQYIKDDITPEDRTEARKLKAKAARYCIIDGRLYRRSYLGPYLRCLGPTEANYVLAELHEGQCGNHAGARSLANRAHTAGYYWPTMRSDAISYVRKCDSCQRFAQIPRQPAEPLTSIISPWPFMKWGMDIVGKLPTAPGQKVYMLAATDYFSKWIEAESYPQVRDKEVKNFVWKNIICRFGVPSEIVTDNGPQFVSQRFKDFCKEWRIKLIFSTPRHPQANGLAESSNKVIISTLKKRLENAKGRWAEELPGVLWSHRTTPRTPTGETPFSLIYGVEAVIPAEVGLPTLRIAQASEKQNNEGMLRELDVIEERREQAFLRMAVYQQKMAKHYNKNVRARTFKPGDWVLRKVFENTKEVNAGKLGPNWEGPYLVTKIVGQGAYKLSTKDGKDVPNNWNAIHLKRYHF